MTERQCPLGLNCSQMGLHEGERGDCINEEACDRYTEPWELYEIVILKGLPGAIYLCWYGRNSSGDCWTEEKWGFKRLNNWDWLLYYTATLNSFEDWQTAYHKLGNTRNGKFIRSEVWNNFERLRGQVDHQYRPDIDSIPF